VSTGPRKDAPPPGPESDSESSEGLLTSQDLFGDLIDAPLDADTPRPPASARAAPIRVQVSEGGEAGPPKPKEPDVLPEEMAALLDAFSDASQATSPEPTSPAPAVAAELEPPVAVVAPPAPAASPLTQSDEEDLSGLLESLDTVPEAPAAPAAEAPPVMEEAPATVAASVPEPEPAPPAEEEAVVLDDLLGSLTEADPEHTLTPGMLSSAALMDIIAGRDPEKTVAPGKMKAPVFDDLEPPSRAARPGPPAAERQPAAPPPPVAAAAAKPLTDLDSLLEDVLGPTLPADTQQSVAADKPAGLETPIAAEPAARLATKFAAAEPKIAASGESRMMLDLAGLAEDAWSEPPPPAPGEVGGTKHGVGDIYGPYHLVEKVASGGMAEVFRAKRTGVEGFEKVLAVKRILPHLSDNKEFVDMFVDEAKMVAGLTHPSIVQIFDLGKIERTYFIAMEYVHGRDLRTILRRAKDKGIRVPLDLSVLIVSRVCAALEYAHRKKDEAGRSLKIVHRDISPQNILIAFEGDVKLTDFGIAKATTKATSTDRGALRGKLLYMSPEQAWGKLMDKRSDIFSLGVVFYEMITDRKPFLGTSEKGILELVRECRIAPPSSLNPRVPERLEKVVMKALAPEPEQRYQDAGEMLRELERALPERQPPSATELARFMEVLFEHEERGEKTPHEASHESDKQRADGPLEIDLGPEPKGAAKPDAQKGFGRLLKKFGIK
jgi:serine/threonine protein kinase